MAGWFWHLGFVELWDPDILAASLVMIALYVAAIGPLRRLFAGAAPVPWRQVLSFVAGIITLYVAVGSPLDALSDEYLFSAHMLEHLLLTMVTVPLVLAGLPAWLVRPALRFGPFAAALRLFARPVVAVTVFNLVFTLWHFPVLFDAALANEDMHFLEHATLVAAAVGMWWPILSPLPELGRLHDGLQMLYLFVDGAFMLGVFAFVTMGRVPLYGPYAEARRVIPSVGPLVDQELGGILMNLVTMVVYGLMFLLAFARWAGRERRMEPGGAAVAQGRWPSATDRQRTGPPGRSPG